MTVRDSPQGAQPRQSRQLSGQVGLTAAAALEPARRTDTDRVATTLFVVYPPGIATIVPGERLSARAKPMLDYLKVFEQSANLFPGFEVECKASTASSSRTDQSGSTPTWTTDTLRNMVAVDVEHGRHVASQRDGAACACACSCDAPLGRERRSCVTRVTDCAIYVHPDRLRIGVGRALLPALIEACASVGFRQMIGYIDSANVASLRLHEACGFRQVGYLRAVASIISIPLRKAAPNQGSLFNENGGPSSVIIDIVKRTAAFPATIAIALELHPLRDDRTQQRAIVLGVVKFGVGHRDASRPASCAATGAFTPRAARPARSAFECCPCGQA